MHLALKVVSFFGTIVLKLHWLKHRRQAVAREEGGGDTVLFSFSLNHHQSASPYPRPAQIRRLKAPLPMLVQWASADLQQRFFPSFPMQLRHNRKLFLSLRLLSCLLQQPC